VYHGGVRQPLEGSSLSAAPGGDRLSYSLIQLLAVDAGATRAAARHHRQLTAFVVQSSNGGAVLGNQAVGQVMEHGSGKGALPFGERA